MAYHITPSLGIDFARSGGLPYYDGNFSVPSPALGTKVVGSDGHAYVFVEASAALATSGTDVTITEPAFTIADGAGAGTYETIADGIADGDYVWVKKTAI